MPTTNLGFGVLAPNEASGQSRRTKKMVRRRVVMRPKISKGCYAACLAPDLRVVELRRWSNCLNVRTFSTEPFRVRGCAVEMCAGLEELPFTVGGGGRSSSKQRRNLLF